MLQHVGPLWENVINDERTAVFCTSVCTSYLHVHIEECTNVYSVPVIPLLWSVHSRSDEGSAYGEAAVVESGSLQ